MENEIFVTIVNVWVKEQNIGDFIKETVTNHKSSVMEPGNLRFDILQDKSNPGKFTLYEAYISEEHAKAHKDTLHYNKWRDAVASMMARPREGISHSVIMPEQPDQWKKMDIE